MKLPISIIANVFKVDGLEELGDIVDVEFEVPAIPFPTGPFKIVPIKGDRFTNFEIATIAMAKNLINKYPNLFGNNSPTNLARLFRDEFIITLSKLSEQGKYVFQALVDRKPQKQKQQKQEVSIDNLLDSMADFEDDDSDKDEDVDVKGLNAYTNHSSVGKVERSIKTKKVNKPVEKEEDDEVMDVVEAYKEPTGEGDGAVTTYKIKPTKRKVGYIGMPQTDVKKVGPGIYEKGPKYDAQFKKGAGFREI